MATPGQESPSSLCSPALFCFPLLTPTPVAEICTAQSFQRQASLLQRTSWRGDPLFWPPAEGYACFQDLLRSVPQGRRTILSSLSRHPRLKRLSLAGVLGQNKGWRCSAAGPESNHPASGAVGIHPERPLSALRWCCFGAVRPDELRARNGEI